MAQFWHTLFDERAVATWMVDYTNTPVLAELIELQNSGAPAVLHTPSKMPHLGTTERTKNDQTKTFQYNKVWGLKAIAHLESGSFHDF